MEKEKNGRNIKWKRKWKIADLCHFRFLISRGLLGERVVE